MYTGTAIRIISNSAAKAGFCLAEDNSVLVTLSPIKGLTKHHEFGERGEYCVIMLDPESNEFCVQ